jgi:hypothetical protein
MKFKYMVPYKPEHKVILYFLNYKITKEKFLRQK